jgi:hypothetical protein
MARVNPEFARRVCEELDRRGLSLRQARIRTGVDIDTIGRMRAGDVPRIDKVIDFARGFGFSINEWLELAGYEPILPASMDEAVEATMHVASRETDPPDTRYEPDPAELDYIRGYRGLEGLSENDLRIVARVFRKVADARAKRQGRELAEE